MTRPTAALPFDELDLKDVAKILHRVFPEYSLCECARMASDFTPEEGCVCSLCPAGTYPGCVRRRRLEAARKGDAAQRTA